MRDVPCLLYTSNEKDENVFGHACREHVAADESVGTNREGETCR